MDYVVREFSLEDKRDAELVAAMWNASDDGWPGTWTHGVPETAERVYEHHLKHEHMAVFLAELEGAVVGYCSLEHTRGRDDCAYLGLLNVRPDYQGKKLGKALVLAAVKRTVERGHKLLTIGTWAGNMKSVPLYKKAGFFWIPETSVYMHNYVPTVLSMPLTREFFAGRDWYQCFARDIVVAPDEIEWKGIKVFPYRFEDGDEAVSVWIDMKAEAPTAVETGAIYAECVVGKEDVPCAVPHTVRWEIVSRDGQPHQVTLIAEGPEGIGVSVAENLQVDDRAVVERQFTVDPEIKPVEPGMPAHRITTRLIVDGTPVTLGTAVAAVQPVDIQFGGQVLVPGKAREKVVVKLKSNLEFEVEGELLIDPHPALAFERMTAPFRLAPKSWTSVTLFAQMQDPEVAKTAMRVVCRGEAKEPIRTKAKTVTFRPMPLQDMYVWEDDEAKTVAVETPALSLVVRRRGGNLGVVERQSGRQLINLPQPEVGPPFAGWRRVPPTYEHRVEHRGGAIALTLVMPSDTAVGITVERTLTVGAGQILRVDDRVLNTTDVAQKLKLLSSAWSNLWGRTAAPLKEGLLRETFGAWGDFHGHDPDVSKKPEDYAESWIASEHAGLVAGMVFGQCEERNGMTLQFDLPEIAPRSHLDLAPRYLVAGRGDWQTVRKLWCTLHLPSTVREERMPVPLPVVSAALEPAPLLVTAKETRCTFAVRSLRGNKLDGEWSIEGAGVAVEPAAGKLEAVRRGEPLEQDVTVTITDPAPRALSPVVRLARPETHQDIPLPVIVLGDRSQEVALDADDDGVVVNNGHMVFRVHPGFLGTVTSLERNGVEHLASSWPEARPMMWFNPWYGGINPQVMGHSGYQKLVKETFTGGPCERTGARGIQWRGARVGCDFEHKDLRWLRMECEYLTTGGSNLMALRQRAVNRTDSPQYASIGLSVWPTPGGAVDDNVLHYEQERPVRGQAASPQEAEHVLCAHVHSAQEFNASCRRWCAVESPATGEAFVAVVPHHTCSLHAWHCGGGYVLDVHAGLSLEPGETKEVVWWLMLCGSMEQARAYRSLIELCELP